MYVDAKLVDDWHKQRGWSGIGYHFFIKRDGQIELGRPLQKQGAHTKNQNKNSIGLCYAGGVDEVPVLASTTCDATNPAKAGTHMIGDL